MESAQAKILLSVYIQTTCYHNFKREQTPDIFNSIFSFVCILKKMKHKTYRFNKFKFLFLLYFLNFKNIF